MPDYRILRNQVRDQLLQQMHDGMLTNGSSINLASISRALGVSATPIREALSQLEYAKVVKAIPKSGFVIPMLHQTEAKQLYTTMAQLEMIALDDIVFGEENILELHNNLDLVLKAETSYERLMARFRFNDSLLKTCENQILLQILDNLKTRLLFYEKMVDSNDAFHRLMTNQYEAIIQAIEEENIPAACLVVKMNRIAIMNHVLERIPR